jgi:asparagine synthase (glutamine-hydrolysing)
MCGIAGQLAAPGRAIDEAALAAASELLAHRGPDDFAYLGWRDGHPLHPTRDPRTLAGAPLGLAHRRLSILDLSPAGRQPMIAGDGVRAIVFNGEIYNYRELRSELERAGRRFATESDTEILLAAYSAWGDAAFARFTGMFALAILDLPARALVLARDPFGIKPLYWTRHGGALSFASEIPALLALSGAPPRAHPARLYAYLRYGLSDHGDATLFAGIEQLPAGTLLRVPLDDPSSGRPGRYWELPDGPPAALSFPEAAEELQRLFLESVALHLRSDVPVGSALSGGIDSSSIVAAIRALEGDALDQHAVSYVADDPALSEERWIEEAARAARVTLHRTSPREDELVADLERLIRVQGEPFGSTSIYAQHAVFRAAAGAGLKVMLDGQGADELLAGYRPHLAARAVSLLAAGRFLDAWSFARSAARLPGDTAATLRSGLVFHLLPASLHGLARGAAGKPFVPPWLDARAFPGVDLATSPFPRMVGRSALRDLLRSQLFETSLPMLLRYEDRNSMAFSIESRVPFLTTDLAAFLLSLPEEYLVAPDGTSKAVFRAAMRGLVPDAILERKDKIGFATPERAWLTRLAPWVDGVLASDTARAIPALVLPEVRAEWDGIRTGARPFGWHLWRVINLVRWTEAFGVSYEA